jgi:hypothetical protein
VTREKQVGGCPSYSRLDQTGSAQRESSLFCQRLIGASTEVFVVDVAMFRDVGRWRGGEWVILNDCIEEKEEGE